MTLRRHPTRGYGHQLYHLLRTFVASAAFLMLLLQAPLAVADDETCPDISISTSYFPQVPKAGRHVTVTVRLTVSSSVAGPLVLVAHVPNGLDLVGKPRRPKGGGNKEVAFYSQYDDTDDEHMLVWEKIDLSSGFRGASKVSKPLIFRFRLKVEDCLPSEVFEIDFLTLLMDGSCLELKVTDLLKVQPKKHLSCAAGSGKALKGQVAAAATCGNCGSAVPETYALILSPGPQTKWGNVDWGAYHITVSGYSLTLEQKKKLKTALQLASPRPGIQFNTCKPVYYPTINYNSSTQSNFSNPSPTYWYRPIESASVLHDGLLLDSATLCSLKQRLIVWADANTNPTINSTFKSKGPEPVPGSNCRFKDGNCPCRYPVHTHKKVPFPYHVTLAKYNAAVPNFSWDEIVRPDFNGSKKLPWYLYLNKEPPCACQKCGFCDAEKKSAVYWDKITCTL